MKFQTSFIKKVFILLLVCITQSFAFEYILEKTFLQNPILVKKEIALSVEKENTTLQADIYKLKYTIALNCVKYTLQVLKNEDISNLYYEKNQAFLKEVEAHKYTKEELKLLKQYIQETSQNLHTQQKKQQNSLQLYKSYTKLSYQRSNLVKLLENIQLSKTPKQAFHIFEQQSKENQQALADSLNHTSIKEQIGKYFNENKDLLQEQQLLLKQKQTLESNLLAQSNFVSSLTLQKKIINTQKELISLYYELLFQKAKIAFMQGTLLKDLKKKLPIEEKIMPNEIKTIKTAVKKEQKVAIRTLPKKNPFKFTKLKRIHFSGNSSEVSSYSIYIVQRNAQLLAKMKDYKLELFGYSDNLGTKEQNYKIALKRATKTKEALMSFGANPDKIKVFSKGDSDPIATNKTAKGRLLNRRVEFNLIKGK